MSRATDFLLSRNGRDQYGNAGDGSRASEAVRGPRTDGMWAVHRALHDQLVERYGDAWLARYAGQSRQKVWEDLRRGQSSFCSLSTFHKMVKEFDSYERFLLYWLVSDKRFALTLLDVPVANIDAEMEKYRECGGYMVSYGGSDRIFRTKDWRNEPKKRWVSGVGMVDRTPVPPVRTPRG